jgi:hypothetical protein
MDYAHGSLIRLNRESGGPSRLRINKTAALHIGDAPGPAQLLREFIAAFGLLRLICDPHVFDPASVASDALMTLCDGK